MTNTELTLIQFNVKANLSGSLRSVIIPIGVNTFFEGGQAHLIVENSKQFCMVRSDEINLSVDSLKNYEIKKPISVHIECIDDDEFLAEVPGMNIAMTGYSVADALTMLKENIEAIFERYKSKERLGAEPSRQLQFLEAHIGAERRK